VTFFDSDIVQNELKEIGFLQERIASTMLSFEQMSKEEKLEHIEMLEELLDKQRVLYARLSLSDDPKASEMKGRLDQSLQLLGLPFDMSVGDVFQNMSNLIQFSKSQLQND